MPNLLRFTWNLFGIHRLSNLKKRAYILSAYSVQNKVKKKILSCCSEEILIGWREKVRHNKLNGIASPLEAQDGNGSRVKV